MHSSNIIHLPNGRERGKKREREIKGDEGEITLSYYLPPINNRDLVLCIMHILCMCLGQSYI